MSKRAIWKVLKWVALSTVIVAAGVVTLVLYLASKLLDHLADESNRFGIEAEAQILSASGPNFNDPRPSVAGYRFHLRWKGDDDKFLYADMRLPRSDEFVKTMTVGCRNGLNQIHECLTTSSLRIKYLPANKISLPYRLLVIHEYVVIIPEDKPSLSRGCHDPLENC